MPTVLHVGFARTFMFFAGMMGLWGMYLYVRKQPVSPSYRGALVIGSGLAILQALVGLVLLIGGGSPEQRIHLLYGVLSAVVWPASFGYTRGKEGRDEALIFGLASLFLLGLTIRAFTTGG